MRAPRWSVQPCSFVIALVFLTAPLPLRAAEERAAPVRELGKARRMSNVKLNAGAATLQLEAALREHVYLPFGIRCLVTARKAA